MGALFAVALLARLAYQAQVHSVGLFGLNTVKGSDMLGFVTWAQEILSGDLIGGSRGAFYQGPLYPYFLAFWLFLFRGSTIAAAVAQATLGAAACLLVFDLGRRTFGRRVGLVAGALAAAYPIFWHYEGLLLSDNLQLWLCLAALDLLLLAAASGRARWYALAGAVVGLTVLTRPNVALFGVVAAGWIVWRERAGGWKRVVQTAVPFVLVAAVVVAPIMLRNLLVAGDPVIASRNAANTWRIGNSSDSNGFYIVAPQGELLSPATLEFWSLQLWKARLFFGSYEVPDNSNYYQFQDNLWLLGANPLSVGLALLVPLAIAGAVLARRRLREPAAVLLGAFLLAYASVTIPFIVLSRYRLPFVGVLIVFAALGVSEVWRLYQERRQQLALACIAAVLALGVLNVPWSLASQPVQPYYTQFLAGYFADRHDLPAAARQYERMLDRASDHESTCAALANLGAIYADLGQRQRALTMFDRVLEQSPPCAERERVAAQSLQLRGGR